MTQKKSDDAVSPVIGVMLMLVITIVVAGVIAAFGTSMAGDVEPAPNVVLDVKILSNFGALASEHGELVGPDFQILHVSGDPLDTGDIEIRMEWNDPDGKFHESSYSAAVFKENHPNGVSGQGGTRNQPMYVKTPVPVGESYTYGSVEGNPYDYYFGDAVLTTGLRLTASTDWLKDKAKNIGSEFMDAIFDSSGTIKTANSVTDPGIMKCLPRGTPVDITIIHIPSSTIIYEKEVIVE